MSGQPNRRPFHQLNSALSVHELDPERLLDSYVESVDPVVESSDDRFLVVVVAVAAPVARLRLLPVDDEDDVREPDDEERELPDELEVRPDDRFEDERPEDDEREEDEDELDDERDERELLVLDPVVVRERLPDEVERPDESLLASFVVSFVSLVSLVSSSESLDPLERDFPRFQMSPEGKLILRL
ncbi:hypothetical protein [Haloarchaeobius sp. DFWS5]|uniref:hypothetical protein n=1 Tax=Haloarchaeobius sp. DFWS5 TaxID=3446114 RepID=UPI003EB699CA